ncbi:hypothetical protein NJB93_20020 [Brucella intermedia]|uniref:hypothetical protein n=1 Tax=Brucella intermedia TaxID=94625 RepID=UPI00209B7CEE|nr:hypothetical protein [Brucella intermedia]MCO7728863.1 hypothetical protein [Brucella intermedia]
MQGATAISPSQPQRDLKFTFFARETSESSDSANQTLLNLARRGRYYIGAMLGDPIRFRSARLREKADVAHWNASVRAGPVETLATPAIDSETKPATCSDFIPASIPI